MEWLVWSLIFPVVKSHAAEWANNFNQKSVLISVFGINQKLSSVEKENNASQCQVRWQKVSDSIVITCVHVEAWVAPDYKDGKLQEHNVSIVSLVEWNFLCSSHCPSQKWISQHAVNKESWEVPQPGKLASDGWKSFHLELPVVFLNVLTVWFTEVLIGLSEVKSWDKENENCGNKWYHKSKRFISDEVTKSFSFGVEESGSHS